MTSPVNLEMFNTIVYAFTALIISCVIALTVIGSIAFYRTGAGAAKSFGLLLIRADFLRITTIIICIFAVVALALGDKLTDGATSLISGIAGFILGGTIKNSTPEEAPPK